MGNIASPASELRVIETAKKIVKGKTKMSVVGWLKETYGYSDVQAEKYYAAGLRYLLPSPEEQMEFREKLQAKLFARYEALYEQAEEQHNIKAAREILDSMAKLFGFTNRNMVQIAENADGDKVINISFN